MKHKTFYRINVEYTIKNSKTNKDEVKKEQLNIIALNGYKAMDLAYEIIKHKYNISSYVGCAVTEKYYIYE